MSQLLELIERISSNEANSKDVEVMNRIGGTMEAGSLCFHGQLGYNPLRSAIENFPDDFQSHLEDKKCPSGSCDTRLIAPRNTRTFGEERRLELVRLGKTK